MTNGKKYIKQFRILCLFLLSVFLFTSCSMNGLFGNKNDSGSGLEQPGDDALNSDAEDGTLNGSLDDTEIALTVLTGEETSDRVPAGSVDTESNPGVQPDSDPTSVQMELQLYFADRKAVEDGKLGPYGFVTPVVRHIPATSGILAEAMKELVKGPLPEEEGINPTIPASAAVNKVSIKDGIALIDFNQAMADDHKGGTLAGAVTMQSIVFTASQFDSVDGVLVTVEGQPWSDGHFIWDTPFYADELAKNYSRND
jgi:spore germination protein GerM